MLLSRSRSYLGYVCDSGFLRNDPTLCELRRDKGVSARGTAPWPEIMERVGVGGGCPEGHGSARSDVCCKEGATEQGPRWPSSTGLQPRAALAPGTRLSGGAGGCKQPGLRAMWGGLKRLAGLTITPVGVGVWGWGGGFKGKLPGPVAPQSISGPGPAVCRSPAPQTHIVMAYLEANGGRVEPSVGSCQATAIPQQTAIPTAVVG